MIQQAQTPASSAKLREKLNDIDSDKIRILFLERQNLQQGCLIHLKRSWENLTNLSLGFNQIKMLNKLNECIFPNLLQLYLNNNNIVSIEALTLIETPKLTKLILKNNKINSIYFMRKLYVPSLSHLSLYGNKINQYKGFSQIQTQISILQLEYTNNLTMGQDESWLLKIKTNKIQKLSYLSSKRINQPKISDVLHQKFQRIQRQN